MRIIDAKNLEKQVKEAFEKTNPVLMGCLLRWIRYQPTIDAADVVEQEQESKPLNGWISVQDRLPEVGGYVVCIAKRNPFSRFMPMVARIEKNGWVNPITEQYISEVTHWMPMPNPPKGE